MSKVSLRDILSGNMKVLLIIGYLFVFGSVGDTESSISKQFSTTTTTLSAMSTTDEANNASIEVISTASMDGLISTSTTIMSSATSETPTPTAATNRTGNEPPTANISTAVDQNTTAAMTTPITTALPTMSTTGEGNNKTLTKITTENNREHTETTDSSTSDRQHHTTYASPTPLLTHSPLENTGTIQHVEKVTTPGNDGSKEQVVTGVVIGCVVLLLIIIVVVIAIKKYPGLTKKQGYGMFRNLDHDEESAWTFNNPTYGASVTSTKSKNGGYSHLS